MASATTAQLTAEKNARPAADTALTDRLAALEAEVATIAKRSPFMPQSPTPPAQPSTVISNIAETGVTTTGATIIWNVTPASTGQIEYGTTASYGSTSALESGLLTSHSRPLTGLAESTTYHYRVKVTNSLGTFYSLDRTFATAGIRITAGPTASAITSAGATITWYLSEVGQGWVEYGTSESYGLETTHETSFTYAYHIQAITGIAAGTLVYYKVHSVSQGSVEVTATGTFTTTSPVVSTSIYGPGIGGDSLANTSWAGTDYGHGWVFRSPVSSNLVSFLGYWLGPPDPGYAEGTGGTYRVDIWAVGVDGLPTGSALFTQNFAAWGANGADVDRRITLSSSFAMTAGTRYALTTRNTDASPSVNFSAWDDWVNGGYLSGGIGAAAAAFSGGQLNPRYAEGDWEVIQRFGGTWYHRDGYTPVLELEFSNGLGFGSSYAENDGYASESVCGRIEGTTHKVREVFTPTSTVTTTGAGIRLLRASGSGALTVAIKTTAGATIDSFTVAAALIPVGPVPGEDDGIWDNTGRGATWHTGTWSTSRALTSGTQYALELSCPVGTRYWTWPFRKLSAGYDYSDATGFSVGWCEKTTDGSAWSVLGDESPTHNSDLQFHLTVTG